MLDLGFFTGSDFYPSVVDKERHIATYLAAEPVFAELAETIRLADVLQRLPTLRVPVRDTGFVNLM